VPWFLASFPDGGGLARVPSNRKAQNGRFARFKN
jgi:hypothetical protein